MVGLKPSIAAAHKIVRDANLQDASTWLGCRMAKAPTELQRSLALATHTHPGALIHRQRSIRDFRSLEPTIAKSWNDRFERAAAIEADIASFFQSTSKGKEDLEEDALAQLSFQSELLKPLNSLPWMVAAIAFFKVWAVPVMTVMTPILAWIMPYLLLKFVYALPIDQNQYLSILRGLWSGRMPFPGPGGAGGGDSSLSSLLTPKSLGQFALFAFSFAQSMIQPIQNAMHLYRTDKVFLDLGAKLVELRQIIESFRSDLGRRFPAVRVKLSFSLEELAAADLRRGFLTIVEEPQRLEIALKDLAALEILWRIAQKKELQPVVFKRDVLALEGAFDISLKGDAVVPTSLELAGGAAPHAVVTGPNGGGKSSFLRAILQSVLLGHAYGFAPAAAAAMPRFIWIASGLQLRDTPGTYSMFETEVKFAADCLASSAAVAAPGSVGPGLVLFDELFHSTNPPDGTRSAKVFLENLWGAPAGSVFSLVSTHVFPLVEAAPKHVQAICCPATELPQGSIKYKYSIEPGICRVSSVKKVWERFGLRPAASGQSLPVKEN